MESAWGTTEGRPSVQLYALNLRVKKKSQVNYAEGSQVWQMVKWVMSYQQANGKAGRGRDYVGAFI